MKILEKLQKRLQEGKKDNKGFSLVELIIVIAIMAILIGIVGMNVIPQIENARKATDAEVLSAMVTEAMEAFTKAEAASGNFTIKVTVNEDTHKLEFTPQSDSTKPEYALEKEFANLAKIENRELKSTAGKALTSIEIHCEEKNGVYIGTVTKDGDGNVTSYTPPKDFDGYEFRSR